jgi:hypothetical protein
MAKTLYNYSMQGSGVGEPGRSYQQPSNNINICSISEASIPMFKVWPSINILQIHDDID